MSKNPALRQTSSSPQPRERRTTSGTQRIELPRALPDDAAEPTEFTKAAALLTLPATMRLPEIEIEIEIEIEHAPMPPPAPSRDVRSAVVLGISLLAGCWVATYVVFQVFFP